MIMEYEGMNLDPKLGSKIGNFVKKIHFLVFEFKKTLDFNKAGRNPPPSLILY